jgi:anti-sigma B factor antagonist
LSSHSLSLHVRKVNDSIGVIDIKGDVTAAAESALTDAYNEASTEGIRGIVLNFSDLDYMNSSGIGLLVTLLVRANRQRQKMAAFGLNEHYQQIFQLTRLDEAISICHSEEDAIAATGA